MAACARWLSASATRGRHRAYVECIDECTGLVVARGNGSSLGGVAIDQSGLVGAADVDLERVSQRKSRRGEGRTSWSHMNCDVSASSLLQRDGRT
jgi:hypothetical protein